MDLHEEFIKALYLKVPQRPELINRVAEILRIEKESAYRRLAGKVNFSVREMGVLANVMNISIDTLMHKGSDLQWMPFILESPMKVKTMDAMCDMLHFNLDRMADITREASESGNVYNSMPLEFYMYYPAIMKFMLFKWGHYFVGTREFDNLSQWELPKRLVNIREKLEQSCRFDSIFYIWDNSIIWTIVNEINYFHRIKAICDEEKSVLKEELLLFVTNLELLLQGSTSPTVALFSDMDFYVSSIDMGFICSYYSSGKMNSVTFMTNFSYSSIKDDLESFNRMKEWVKSLRNASVKLSGSGRAERRLFIDSQLKIIRDAL